MITAITLAYTESTRTLALTSSDTAEGNAGTTADTGTVSITVTGIPAGWAGRLDYEVRVRDLAGRTMKAYQYLTMDQAGTSGTVTVDNSILYATILDGKLPVQLVISDAANSQMTASRNLVTLDVAGAVDAVRSDIRAYDPAIRGAIVDAVSDGTTLTLTAIDGTVYTIDLTAGSSGVYWSDVATAWPAVPGATTIPSTGAVAATFYKADDATAALALKADSTALTQEVTDRQTAVTAEAAARADADTAETSARTTADTDEAAARASADTAETSARTAADSALGDRITAETTSRQTADTDEAASRADGDTALQGQIDAITAKKDVIDVVGTYAELEAYPTAGLEDGDVIKVLTDSTHSDAATYYRWATATSAWAYIGSEGASYTKAETDAKVTAEANTRASADTALQTAVDGKQSTLAFDTTPTAGSTNPVTSGGVKTALDAKVTANAAITTGTYPKVTVDSKGLVTAGSALAASDIPTIPESGVTGLVSDLAAKQVKLTFDSTPTASSTNPVTSGGVKTYVDAETTARTSADTTLQSNIDAEASTRSSADTSLGTRVTALESQQSTYIVSFPSDSPTQTEITAAYTTAYPDAPVPPRDGATATDPTRGISYVYSSSSTSWVQSVTPAVGLWTTTNAGIVSSGTADGTLLANSDGTGTVNGWSDKASAASVTSEATTRASADTALQTNIDTEATTRGTADTTLTNNLATEVTDRKAADTALGDRITSEANSRSSADTTLQTNIDSEASSRSSADTTEANTRASADSSLQSQIDSEASTRATAVTGVQTNLNSEASTRSSADTSLQSQIDAITSKKDVIDIVATYAALEAYSTTGLEDGDVIKVLQDETHSSAAAYYRWTLASTVWTYVGMEGPYYTKSETDTAIAAETTARTTADTALQTNIDKKVTANAAITANSSNCNFPAYGTTGLVTGIVATAQQRAININGTSYTLYGTATAALPTIYPPTDAGTSGQLWQSDGSGQGSWQTMDTTPTASSTKAVTSGGVLTALNNKATVASVTSEADTRATADTALQTNIDAKVAKAGDTMTGALVAASGTLTTAQVRNITISTADPSGGSSGDVWLVYTS